jgi:hypothetical protein
VPQQLPDPEISLRESADFILTSRLGRKALRCRELPYLAGFIRDLIENIYRLVQSCHLPEFTDHGLPHLCSLVDRISQWTCAPNRGRTVLLCDLLEEPEAAILLMACLFHDIGMLSQRPEDLALKDAYDLPSG